MPTVAPPAPINLDAMQFCLATEHSPIGTALVALDGRWLNVNAAMTGLLGYNADEFSRMTFQQLTDDTDLKNDMDGIAAMLAGEMGSWVCEKRYLRKDGGWLWVHLTVTLVRDDAGQPLVFLGHVQDISARKADHIERQRLIERASLAGQAAAIGIWEWDLDTNLLSWSPEMFGLFRVEDPGRPLDFSFFTRNLHPEDRAHMNRSIEVALESGLLDTEFRIRCLDGDVRIIKVLGKVYRGENGAPDRMIGANWDVTETRNLTLEAEAASRAKSQFLAVMSHEIRTPMNGILGMAQAMQADNLPPVQRDRLEVIAECGKGLLTILNDILDLSKVEAGKLQIEAAPFDLIKVLGGVAATYAPNAKDRSLVIRLDVDAAHGLYLGDPTRLRQIVSNLVSNALKFTRQGEISIKARRVGSGVRIQVADTGMGMDSPTLDRIFQPFAQEDASTTRRFGGTGLGLSIVRQLARLMGGDVSVASRIGSGSCFTVVLPLERLGDIREDAVPSPATPLLSPSMRVLAAEDNANNRLVLKTLLTQFDIEVTIVADGQQAVELYRSGDWDIVLMDVQMPVLDGLSATRRIRDLEASEGRVRTPILALTANAMDHQRSECLEAGMDDLVAKPIDIRSLLAAMDAVCRDDLPAAPDRVAVG
jgi:PAS domain S-box-containing protein